MEKEFLEHNIPLEPILAVVGFLGAGKTTLLKQLISSYSDAGWDPFVILNDYENAHLDVEQLTDQVEPKWIRALSGSCICCSGIAELRNLVNTIPERKNGITLIEANGTSDACQLMGFLGVGIDDRFLPPVQISVVDVKNWQQRGEHNELEANQVQVSSLILLAHLEVVSETRKSRVIEELKTLNPTANIQNAEELDIVRLTELTPSINTAQKLDHQKSHWSSCSANLPKLPDKTYIEDICRRLPKSIMRVKGCVQIGGDENHTYFERLPDGSVHIRPFNGWPTMGSKILIVGPNSNPLLLEEVINASLNVA